MARPIHEAIADLYETVPSAREANGLVSQGRIAEAEAVLGVVFPQSYRSFVHRHGGWTVGGYEVSGLLPDEFARSAESEGEYAADVVRVTRFEREAMNLPPHLVVLLREDDGAMYCLDTSRQDAEEESPVVALEIGSDEFEDFSPNFIEFLLTMEENHR